MNIEEIYAAINPMPAMMSAKGKVSPTATLHIEANARISLLLTNEKPNNYGAREREYKCFIGETADEVIGKAVTFIKDLPDAKIARLHDFLGQLGKVIESGRDLGIDVDYLNPLTDTMKRLSENVITHQQLNGAA